MRVAVPMLMVRWGAVSDSPWGIAMVASNGGKVQVNTNVMALPCHGSTHHVYKGVILQRPHGQLVREVFHLPEPHPCTPFSILCNYQRYP